MAETSFTVEEMAVMHQALLESLKKLQGNSHRIKKEHGTDVYDSIKSRHITAAEKIEALVKAFRAKENDEK